MTHEKESSHHRCNWSSWSGVCPILNDHPWFEVTQIAASERSAGKKYVDAIRDDSGIVAWDVGGEIPDYIKEMPVLTIDEINVAELDLIFSAVESQAAINIETKFALSLIHI